MTVNRGLFVRNNGSVGTTPIEGRLALASLIVENAPGSPRQGLIGQDADIVVSGTGAMTYSVGPCSVVSNRASGEGVYVFTLTGTTTVDTTAAPSSGSRWDLVYVKQNDPDKGDADNVPVLGVVQGDAATSPSKPYANVPAGAYVLAEAQVSAGATATNGASVTITQAWRYTALRGTAVKVRSKSERDEITATKGLEVARLDMVGGSRERYDGAGWRGLFIHSEWTGSYGFVTGQLWGVGPLSRDSANCFNDGAVVSPANDALTIPKGVLDLYVRVRMSYSATASAWVSVRRGAPDGTEVGSGDIAIGNSSTSIRIPINVTDPTQTYYVRFYCGSGNSGTLTSKIVAEKRW